MSGAVPSAIENRVKELQLGLAIGRTSCTLFLASQRARAADRRRAQVWTLREQLLKLGGWIRVSARRIVLSTLYRARMRKSEVAAHIAEKFEITKRTGRMILEELAILAGKEARKRGFAFPGVGRLVVVSRKARVGRNPQTGEPIRIPARRVLKVRITKAMKRRALKGR